MEQNTTEKTGLRALALLNPSLYGDMARYFRPTPDAPLKITMQSQIFDVMSAVQMINGGGINVIILDPHVDGFNADDFVGLRQKSKSPVLLVTLANPGADMEQMLHLGVDAAYTLPITEETVTRMFSELPEKYKAISENWQKGAWDSIAPQQLREVVSQAAAANWQKSVISVWSPKGGVGKTTVSVELASVLAGVGGRNVCLLDTNLNGGHVRMRLSIKSEHSIVSVASMYAGAMENNKSWVEAQREINQEMEKFLVPVPGSMNENGKCNFYVIPGITTQNQARSTYLQKDVGDFMRCLIDYLRQRFDFVVIDVGSSVNVPLHRESFANSDTILVVCDPDAAGIADTKKSIDGALSGFIPREKFSLVLNRWMENLGISIQEVSDQLGISVRGFITDDYLGGVKLAGNAGRSYVVSNNKKADNPIATEKTMQGFVNLAATFYPPISAAWDARVSSVKNMDKSKFSSSKKDTKKLPKVKDKNKKSLFQRLFGKG